jgi:hypothetical protein
VEVRTHFGSNVAMLKSDVVDVMHQRVEPNPAGTDNIRDQETLALIKGQGFTFSNYDPERDQGLVKQ